jgi:argininosuccinate lyase
MKNETLGQRHKVDQQIEAFTVGKDREMDLYLAPFDVLGTMAHITMLEKVGLLPSKIFLYFGRT